MRAILPTSLLLLSVVVCAAEDKPPEPKLPIGKETTRVTGPFDKYGFIDYEAALNAELSQGVKAEKNAAAALAAVLGPAPEGGDGIPAAYFKWLDIPAPPSDGDYFISQGAYIHNKLGIAGEQLEKLYDVQSRATQRPWVPKDAPPLAEWLKVNEKQLALVIEAVKRPQYFNPLVSRKKEGEPSNLIGVQISNAQKCRELASSLSLRAMLNVKAGKLDDAWRDILACHRLGRQVGRGATLIEGLVGYAICQIASNATITYLAHADLTSKQAMDRLKELQSLPPLPRMADKIDTGERFMGLDALQLMRRGNIDLGLAPGAGKPTDEERKGLDALDWGLIMQNMNKFYDQMSARMRLKDRTAREKELDKIEAELKEATKKVSEADLKKLIKDGGEKKAVSKKISDTLLGLLAPAVRKVQLAEDRTSQVAGNLQIAFAMAAYHKDNGRYPAKLTDFAPKYLATVPDDLFSGKPLIYKPSENGYLFYSVGPNGKDDGGHWYDDNPSGDDPRVKLPLPELKKN